MNTYDLLGVVQSRIDSLTENEGIALRDVLLQDIFHDLKHVNFNRAFKQFLENYPDITCGKFYQLPKSTLSDLPLFGRHKFANIMFIKSMLYVAFQQLSLNDYRFKKVQTMLVLCGKNNEDVKPLKIETRVVKLERNYRDVIGQCFEKCLENYESGITTQYAYAFFGHFVYVAHQFKCLTIILDKYPQIKVFDLLLIDEKMLEEIEGFSEHRHKRNIGYIQEVIMNLLIEDPKYLETNTAKNIASKDKIKLLKITALEERKKRGL